MNEEMEHTQHILEAALGLVLDVFLQSLPKHGAISGMMPFCILPGTGNCSHVNVAWGVYYISVSSWYFLSTERAFSFVFPQVFLHRVLSQLHVFCLLHLLQSVAKDVARILT